MKFVEIKDFLSEQRENGLRFMIADEMKYIIEKAYQDTDSYFTDDETYEMLCEKVEQMYLEGLDVETDVYSICKTIWHRYINGNLEGITADDILDELDEVWKY